MKNFILFGLFFGILLNFSLAARPSKKERQVMFDECLAEVPVELEIAEALRAFNFTSEDPNGKCFIKCLCLKETLCHEAINVEMIEGIVPPMAQRMVRENGVTCGEIMGENDCDTAYMRFKCFNNGIPRYIRNMLRDMEQFLF
ncbi:uncharacterized protein LOC134833818 isoform X2 [Culicoides brevitarsis]|uniref:uncharacterized protein LOC134833818 isoform X2 n=1 Tax=Culicoides brevitarsis TaxID=469753 RepID=UPI00307B9B45